MLIPYESIIAPQHVSAGPARRAQRAVHGAYSGDIARRQVTFVATNTLDKGRPHSDARVFRRDGNNSAQALLAAVVLSPLADQSARSRAASGPATEAVRQDYDQYAGERQSPTCDVR